MGPHTLIQYFPVLFSEKTTEERRDKERDKEEQPLRSEAKRVQTTLRGGKREKGDEKDKKTDP
jgi:hypothetical protein